MLLTKYILVLIMLLLAGVASAQMPTKDAAFNRVVMESANVQNVHEEDWFSYRDAYRMMLVFEKYGKPKQFIQNHLQIVSKNKNVPLEGLRLILRRKSSQLNLPLDAIGRVVFPFLKTAYDENAEIILNRSSGQYRFRPRVSIAPRPEGVYEIADLYAACMQILAYQNYLDRGESSEKKCVGVRFVYEKKESNVRIEYKKNEGPLQLLPILEGGAFWDDSNEGFKIVNTFFSSEVEQGQVIVNTAPIAISALFSK